MRGGISEELTHLICINALAAKEKSRVMEFLISENVSNKMAVQTLIEKSSTCYNIKHIIQSAIVIFS